MKLLITFLSLIVALFISSSANAQCPPVDLVLTGSTICTTPGGNGTITSSTSVIGVNYQLYDVSNATVGSPQAGTGSGLIWSSLLAGTGYYVVSTRIDPPGCVDVGGSNAVDVGTYTNPIALVLTGSTICTTPDGNGTITSGTSETGVSYQLYDGSSNPVGSPQTGTGSGLIWSSLVAGTGYYAIGTDVNTCVSPSSNAVDVGTYTNPTPTASSNTPVCSGNTLNLSVTTGTSWNWTGPNSFTSTNQNPTISNVTTAATGTYYVTVTDVNGCTGVSSTSVTVTPSNNTISGTLLYNNIAHSPMTSVTLTLYKSNGSGGWISQGTYLTASGGSSTGYYEFTGLCYGDYKIAVTNNNHPDNSINSTDAAQVNAYHANPVNYGYIEHVRYLAGDVYGNGLGDPDYYINATDAQHIQQRFIYGPGCGCFDRGPWSYWIAGETVPDNGSPLVKNYDDILVTVNSSSLTVNLYAEVTGDFNMSYMPSTTKDASFHLQLTYTGTQKAGANSTFELPIHVVPATNVGAVSMILNFPSDLVQIQGVSMNDGSGNLDWDVNGNELKIGWNSLSPLSLAAGENLVTLSLKTTGAFSQGNSIRFELAPSVLNELADGNYNVIPDGLLSMDAVEYSPVGINEPPAVSSLTLQNFPNPFSDYTNIVYNLPEDGKVALEIRNLLGQVVKTLVNEPQVKGLHRLKMEAGSMPQGVYTATVRLKNDDENLTRTIKLVVNW